jgi:hypothetical protein
MQRNEKTKHEEEKKRRPARTGMPKTYRQAGELLSTAFSLYPVNTTKQNKQTEQTPTGLWHEDGFQCPANQYGKGCRGAGP